MLTALHRQQNLQISFVCYPSRSNSVYPAGHARDPAAKWAFIFSKSEIINPSDLHEKWRLRWKPRLSRDCVECLSIKYWGHIQQGSDCQFGCLFRQLWIVRIFLLKYKISFSGYNMGFNRTMKAWKLTFVNKVVRIVGLFTSWGVKAMHQRQTSARRVTSRISLELT